MIKTRWYNIEFHKTTQFNVNRARGVARLQNLRWEYGGGGGGEQRDEAEAKGSFFWEEDNKLYKK